MQDAVGPNSSWLEIPGMVSWHVRAAIETLGYEERHGKFDNNCSNV
jgi:hypothetical protein